MVLLPRLAPLLVWQLAAGELRGSLQTHAENSQQARLCLSRVAPLPKAEGYGALCTSIQAQFLQQQSLSSSLAEARGEADQLRASNAKLEKEKDELKAQIAELEQRNAKREQDWQTAAKKFQADVASRDSQWQSTVSQLKSAATTKLVDSLEHTQAVAAETLQEELAQTERATAQKWQKTLTERDTRWATTVHILDSRDARWRATVHRLKSEKKELEQQFLQLKEAAEASTSVTTRRSQAALLALSQERQKTRTESKEVQALLAQINALQRENAQLVQGSAAL